MKGCPARARSIKELLKVIRNRDVQTGIAASRHHAVAMTIQDLDTIIRWSEEVVPPNLTQPDQTGSMQMPLYTFLKHNMMRAFLSTGFTLWTRLATPIINIQLGLTSCP